MASRAPSACAGRARPNRDRPPAHHRQFTPRHRPTSSLPESIQICQQRPLLSPILLRALVYFAYAHNFDCFTLNNRDVVSSHSGVARSSHLRGKLARKSVKKGERSTKRKRLLLKYLKMTAVSGVPMTALTQFQSFV